MTPREPVCEDTGRVAVQGACPVHGGDACLVMPAPRWAWMWWWGVACLLGAALTLAVP